MNGKGFQDRVDMYVLTEPGPTPVLLFAHDSTRMLGRERARCFMGISG